MIFFLSCSVREIKICRESGAITKMKDSSNMLIEELSLLNIDAHKFRENSEAELVWEASADAVGLQYLKCTWELCFQILSRSRTLTKLHYFRSATCFEATLNI